MKTKEFISITSQIKQLEKLNKIKGRSEDRDQEIKNLYDKLKECKVYVSYMIGSREYYEKAYKVGKSYYSWCFDKMIRSRGYHSIERINKITDSMKNAMQLDLFYY